MTNRYEFLTSLHQLLDPKTYLEVGVQYGWSFNLAQNADVAIGIDPNPLCAPVGNQVIFTMTSDEYFSSHFGVGDNLIDLAFIDGMHLYEFALRDFVNVERISHRNTVVVFDDMLPRNQEEAAREQCPGDWTGDVWKVYYLLRTLRPDLHVLLVDTFPTGTMVVTNLDPSFAWNGELIWPEGPAPEDILQRSYAVAPDMALRALKDRA